MSMPQGQAPCIRPTYCRRVEWIVVAVVLIVAAAAGIWFWWRWLMRRRALWSTRLSDAIPVHSKFWRDARKVPGELLYVAIGDSAAQGIGASRPDRGYVGFLRRFIGEVTGKPVRVANLGISGARIRLAIDDELPRLAKLSPDVLTVSIGANDIAAFDPRRFEADIRELFAALPAHAIVADLPSFYFLPGERDVKVANAILRAAAADHGLTVVPLWRSTKRQGLWGVTRQFAGDLFHPNDRGYRVWAKTFEPAVAARLRELAS
ncbi:MAG TPA: SGNH/GDSL hydrolase family protein [Rhodoglobus sp.]|nr:SGNH/GDSL hydrolase family protein [Rhodoglobus sp.]